MEATISLFQYEPVTEREFRVFSFVRCPSPRYEIAIKLESVSFAPGNKLPPYTAISYACGDVQDRVSILVNNADLKIYRSLFRILRELCDDQSTIKYWADAICINQQDLKEKTFQVGFIGLIYTGAELVQVFIDGRSVPISFTSGKIESLINSLSQPPPRGLINKEYCDSRAIPEQSDQIWAELRSFFSQAWFRRLWVMQEAALGRRVVFCWNRQTISLDSLTTLVRNVKRMDMDFLLATPEDSELTTWQTLMSLEQLRGNVGANNLLKVLHLTRSKQCSEPLDRVFAWRWMLPKHVQEEITFGYHIYKQLPYWQSFMELSHIALNEYPDLLTLPCACTEVRIPGMPSWCSNLESEFDSFSFGARVLRAGGPTSADGIGPHIATSRNGRLITLHGIKVTEVKDVVTARYFHKSSHHHDKSNLVSFFRYLSECISFRDKVGEGEKDRYNVLRALVIDEIFTAEGVRATDEELRLCFVSYCQYLHAIQISEPGTFLELDDLTVKRVAQMNMAFPYANTGRRIIMTKDRKYGNAHHTVESGDVICVFRGCDTPLILRYKQASGRYTFVGDIWVSGIMNGEALALELEEEDFVIE